MGNAEASHDQMTLLVVDDESVQRLIVQRAAEKLGYVAAGAASLHEAIAWLQTRTADVLVLDLSLRDHDGIELLRHMAGLGSDPIIIFLSGFDERVRKTAAQLALALGLRVAGTLGKPLQPEKLLAMIGQAPQAPSRPRLKPTPELSPDMLDEAITQNAIQCVFQPKFNLITRRIVGLEALARWDSPTLGIVSPQDFIPLAEQSGQIDRLTMHILDRALAQLRVWHALDPLLTVAVNLSPLSLGDLGLPEKIGAVLHRHRIVADRLVLEVTEGAVMTDYIAAADILTRLRIQGIGVSIDDFGTGHSSLLSLLRLPFNELKIDQSFVRNLTADPEALKIIKGVLSLAASMDLKVVVEGFDNEIIYRTLIDLGATVGQGFFFSKPVGAAAVTAMLEPVSAGP